MAIGRRGARSSSSPSATWDDDDVRLARVLDGAELLVNLAGRSVSCRYSKRNKAAILRSRLGTTKALGRAVALCPQPPSTWLNASTGTIYRNAVDHPQSERDGELGTGFSVDVARLGLGGPMGPGTQKFSWIHVEDLYGRQPEKLLDAGFVYSQLNWDARFSRLPTSGDPAAPHDFRPPGPLPEPG